MKIYLLTCTSKSNNTESAETTIHPYLDKDAAIAEVNRLVEGQKYIERESLVDVFEGCIEHIPGLVFEGLPVYCVRTHTIMHTGPKKQNIVDTYMWRAVFEKEVK